MDTEQTSTGRDIKALKHNQGRTALDLHLLQVIKNFSTLETA